MVVDLESEFRHLMRHNVEKATCTGMLNSVISLAAVFEALQGGIISELLGFKATMYVEATLTITGLILFRIGVKDEAEGL